MLEQRILLLGVQKMIYWWYQGMLDGMESTSEDSTTGV
jgi:hypothetical protein